MANYVIKYILQGQDNASDDFERVGRSMKDTEAAGMTLGSTIKGALGGLALREVVQFGVEMNNAGAEVRKTSATFGELTAGIGGSAQVLMDMREATGGMIKDFDLMAAANSLLLTGAASTSEEVARLTSNAITLGGAMNQGPVEAIQNLNAALMNNSYARLDTLGVSAAAVRIRVEELKASGMDMSEAFKTATLEEMNVSLERLGDAADEAETAVGRLGVRMQNLYDTGAGNVNAAVEPAALVLETLLFTLPEERAAARDAARARADIWYEEVWDAFDDPRFDDMTSAMVSDSDMVKRFIEAQLEALDEGLDIPIEEIIRRAGMNPAQISDETRRALDAAANHIYMYEPQVRMQAIGREQQFYDPMAGIEAGNRQAMRSAEMQAAAGVYDPLLYAEINDSLQTINEAERMRIDSMERMSALSREYSDNLLFIGSMSIMEREDADALEAAAREMEAMVEAAAELGIDTAQFEQAADEAREIADAADEAATRFEDMSLAQALGAQGGATRTYSDLLAATGLEDTEAGQRATGQRTDATDRLENEVVPLIEEIQNQFGDEAAVEAAARFDTTLREELAAGATEDEAIASAYDAIGYKMGESAADEFVVAFGDTLSGLAAQTGMSQEEIARQLGIEGGGTLLPGMTFGGSPELIYTGDPGAAGGSGLNIPEGAGQFGMGEAEKAGGVMAEPLPDLETRSALLTDVRNAMIEIEGATGPDLTAMTLELETSSLTAATLQDKLTAMSAKIYKTKVIIETQINGALPGGRKTLEDAVPIADSEV